MDKDIKQTLKAISTVAKDKFQLSELLNNISEEAKKYLSCECCAIWLYNVNKDRLILTGASQNKRDGIGIFFYEKGEGIIWDIFTEIKEQIIFDKANTTGFWKGKYIELIYPKRKETGVPFCGVPIKLRKQTIGVLTFTTENIGFVFNKRALEFAKIISDEIGIAVDDVNTHLENEVLSTHRKNA